MFSKKIERYIHDCENLKYNLEQIISDIEYIEEGKKIRYAVDFSEIYSYLFPNEKPKEFLLFKDEDKNDREIGILYQSYFLKEMFYNLPDPLILLDSYAIELRNLLRRLHQGDLEQEIEYVRKIYQEKEKILNHEDIDNILQLADKYKHQPQLLRPQEYKRIIKFIEENADNLLRFIAYQDQDFQLVQLIKELFVQKRFEELKNVVKISSFIEDNKDTYNYWYIKLKELRGVESTTDNSDRDASGVAEIEQANQELEKQKEKFKIVLITRSKLMHKISDELVSNKLRSESLLRHPIIFRFLFTINGISEDRQIQLEWLNNRLDKIKVFLDYAQDARELNKQLEKATKQDIHSDQEDKYLKDTEALLKKLKEEWKIENSLVLTLSSKESFFSSNYKEIDEKKIKLFFNFLRDDDELTEHIFDRLENLNNRWQRYQEELGFDLSWENLDSRDQKLLRRLPNLSLSKSYILRTSLESTPFSLKFSTDEARDFLNSFNPSEEYNLINIFQHYTQYFSVDKDTCEYEKLLGMALILGKFNLWKLAEKRCNKALKKAKDNGNIFSHEGYYFLSICMRKRNPLLRERFNRILSAIENLRKATKIKQEANYFKPGQQEDPRYLKEEAIQILQLNLSDKELIKDYQKEFKKLKKEGNNISPDDLTPERGVKLLEQAKKLCSEEDILLKIQILNNILFYKIKTSLLTNKDEIKREYQQLENLQKSIEEDESKWIPAILDTLGWCSWQLYGNKEESLRRLGLALDSGQVAPEELSRVEEHIKTIKTIEEGS